MKSAADLLWGTCSMPDCSRPWIARTLCAMHHQQARQGRIPMPPTLKALGLTRPPKIVPICSVEWCDRPVRSSGYCNSHYQRALRGVDMDSPHRQAPEYPTTCAAEGCDRKQKTRGYCGAHYARLLNGREMGAPVRVVDPDRGCLVAGCDRRHIANGYCALHGARASGKTALPVDAPVRDSLAYPCDFTAAHVRIRALWGSASRYLCIECGDGARDWAYDGTDPTEMLGTSRGSSNGGSLMRYSLYPEFYMPMCRKCHHRRDKGIAAAELREYRLWKHETGLTLSDATALLKRSAA